MCEQCEKKEVSGEPLGQDRKNLPCEFVGQAEEICDKTADYLVSDYSCQQHLCEEHKHQHETNLVEGLAGFLEACGFGQETKLIAIRQTEKCDYIDPAAFVTGKEPPPCGNTAAYAEMVLVDSMLCLQHAKESGYDPTSKVPEA